MRANRRGLSYLEVLIAAGIALMGLMGAIAILPVSLGNMQRGITSDTVAAVGPSALEQTQAMGLNRPRLWIDPSTNQPIEKMPQSGDTQHSARADIGGRYWLNGVGHYESFCIDPRFCAEISTYDTNLHEPYKFPYVKQVTGTNVYDVRMRRITLGNGSGGKMSINQARLLFKMNDDLIYTRPGDQTAPAILEPLVGKSKTPVRRDYMGDYEWIVTVTPQVVLKNEPYTDAFGTNHPRAFQMTGNYNISAVVFHQRNPRLDAIIDTAGTNFTEDERLVDVQFLGNGYNGGDVTIQTRSGRPTSDLDMQVGQWVMLSGMNFRESGVPNPPTSAYTPTAPIFQWYKVVGFSEVYNGNRRDVSLEGQDWPVLPPDTTTTPPTPRNTTPIPNLATVATTGPTTRMTICSNIVGVFSAVAKAKESFIEQRKPFPFGS